LPIETKRIRTILIHTKLANQIIKRANPNPNQIVKSETANQVGFGKSNWQIKFPKWQIQIKLAVADEQSQELVAHLTLIDERGAQRAQLAGSQRAVMAPEAVVQIER
jgi:hypothetical protein